MVNHSGNPRRKRQGNPITLGRGKRRMPSPSRRRYEERNPTISIRVSAELYEALKELKAKGDLSVSEVLKVGLGILSPLTGASFDRGVMQGLAEACFVSCQECQVRFHGWRLGMKILAALMLKGSDQSNHF